MPLIISAPASGPGPLQILVKSGIVEPLMPKRETKKIIQVPIEADLLERIDATVLVVAESRAAFIREACRQRLRTLKERELDRRYVAGYQKTPEGAAWSKASAKLLAKVLPKEAW